VRLSAGEVGDPEGLRASIDREILEKVRASAIMTCLFVSESFSRLIIASPIPLVREPAPSLPKRGDEKR